jgi:hypothetical protein
MSAFKKVMATTIAIGVFAPALAFAETASTSAATLVGQIQTLQTQINSLQQQQQQYLATLRTTLAQGSAGEQVATLQALLAADPSIYPEGIVSGFFGRLTAEAVKRFQKNNGIEQVGFVGPKTLKKLQERLKERPLAFDNATSTKEVRDGEKRDKKQEEKREKKNEDRRPCAIVPPGHLIAPGWLKKHKGEDKPIVPECQKLPKGIKDLLDRDDDDDHGTPKPPSSDTVAPVISTVSVSNISTASVSISWFTNERATGKVYYSTTAPVNLGTALTVSDNSFIKSRTLNLTGLAPSTTYYYVVESKDAALNTSTTPTQGFVTAASPVADTVAPVISTVSVSGISISSASILWQTNESATSKIYFSTTTPVNLSTALTISNNSLVGSHALTLTGLASSTTYYYVVESKDAALNTSITSTQSFVTAAPPVADTVAPVISAISTSNISSTTAMISWQTNELATSKLYYGTTTPVNLGTALTISNNSLVTSHSLGFAGLASSTIYYYVLESVDAALNTATTSTQSFVTTN